MPNLLKGGPTGRRIAVVAHSQGAVIAHRTLRRVGPGEARLGTLVTFGSGQTKLADLESLLDLAQRRSSAAREVWLAPAGLLVVATAVSLALDELSARSGAGGGEADWFGPLWLGLVGLGFTALGIAAARPRTKPSAAELDVGAEQGWLDLYASHDPVPNGPLFHQSAPHESALPVTSVQVHNVASPLRDHVSYWRNTDEFVAMVGAALAAAGGGSIDSTHS